MHRYFAIVIITLSLLPGSAARDDASGADEPLENLTLARAFELVASRNSLLHAASAGVRVSEARLRQARLPPNPELTTTESNLFNDSLTGFDGQTGTYSLEQPIELGGRRAARREAGEAGVEFSRIELSGLRRELEARAQEAFGALLVASERSRIAQESLDLAGRVDAVARARVEAGRLPPVEASRSAILVATARIEKERLESELGVARNRLAATWGGSPRVESVEGEIGSPEDPPPLAELETRLAASPILARWPAALRESDARIRLARAEASPDFALTAGWTDYHDADEGAWLLGLRIELPLADRNQGGIDEAAALKAQVEAQALAAQADARHRLLDAHARAITAATTARAMGDEILPAARSAFETTTIGFEAGKLPYLDVLDARRVLLDTQRLQLDAVAAWQEATAELLRLTDNTPTLSALVPSTPQETP